MFDFFFFKHKTAYEMRISDWSSDVCSSDLKRVKFSSRATAGRVSPEHSNRSVLKYVRVAGTAETRDAWRSRKIHALSYLGTIEIGRASCRERVCQYV